MRTTKSLLYPSFTHSLQEVIGRKDIVGFNVGPEGELYLVLALERLDYTTESKGFATFPKTIPASHQRYRVLVVRKGNVELDLVIDGEPFNIHHVQPLGNELLLACSRSEYRESNDFDLNGRVYNRDGVYLRALLLGDGLESVQATRDGDLWVSYFDEGIFGNFGWTDPVGAAGLLSLDFNGEKVFEFQPNGALDSICDCYALNVATADDVWFYYYTDFPLVHLHKRKIVSSWKAGIAGSHAFAVSDGHALFAGGYDDRDAFQLVRLQSGGVAEIIDRFELIAADDTPIKPERTIGRGSSLYILSEGCIYEIALTDLLEKYGS